MKIMIDRVLMIISTKHSNDNDKYDNKDKTMMKYTEDRNCKETDDRILKRTIN